MSGFTFETTPRILCEDGAAGRLGTLAHERGITRALLVTDRGLVETGIVSLVRAGFAQAGAGAHVFAEVKADPPEEVVLAATTVARTERVNGVIGLGGGSSLDTAKLVALLAGSGETLASIYGVGLARGPRLPLIQVPTTAGTGSEATPIAIVTTPTNEKKGVVSPLLYPDLAVLDPTLTLGLPPRVTAMTGIDAMVHAIEAYTSRLRKNVISDTLAVRALRLLYDNLATAIARPHDLPARRAMLHGSLLAGMAFANAPVAAVHALAYPLGGRFHVPHGLANALVLLPVLAFNRPAAHALYAELAEGAGMRGGAEGLHTALDDLAAGLGLERTLSEVGVKEADLPMLARDAMQVQRLLVNNPRDVTYDDALAIYRQVL
jgi:alcohol dehydrogenase class IV